MKGLLEGIRVIDSTTVVAMPTAMHIMGDMGAQVIKIETHTQTRGEGGTFANNIPPDNEYWNKDGNFHALNRSKLGITLNLQDPDGVNTFKELAALSDVVAENNRAGTMERLGLGYDDLKRIKPDIIYISNTGFGQTGPWRRYAGIGRMFELTCGLSQFTGYEHESPRRVGRFFFDPHVGWTAVFAIMAALHYRNETGKGQWIDLSMYQTGASTMGDVILDFAANKRNGGLRSNRHDSIAPHNVYPCRGDDNWIAIAIENDIEWNALCQAMDNPNWAHNDKFSDAFSRWRNQDELDRNIAAWTGEYDHVELMDQLQAVGIPAGAVLNGKETLTNPHLKARQFYEAVTHPPESGMGTRLYHGRPWKMSDAEAHIRRPAPTVGEHNDYVLGQIMGKEEDEILELHEIGVIGQEPTNPRPANQPVSLDRQLDEGSIKEYDSDYQSQLGITDHE